MLVISRKPGERIRVGEDVVVTVLEVSGSTVRLGIEAPGDVRILRQEVLDAIEAENRAAAGTGLADLPFQPSGS
jgi:carbon storage regulator